MEENTEGLEPLKTNLFPAVVESKLNLDMTKAHGNYRQLVASVLSWEVTDENFEESQELIKKIMTLLKYTEEHRENEKRPYLDAGRTIDASHKQFAAPFEAAKKQLQDKLNIVGRRREEEAKQALAEKQRIEGLQNQINSYVLDASVKIAAATTNEQLLSIERLINLEKGNKSRYQDHLPLLIERCNELTEKLKEQKAVVKEMERLELEKQKAIEAGDDEKVEKLLQQAEILDNQAQENTILVQEIASKSVIVTEIVAPEINMPNTRRKAWKFELLDVKEVMKKRPDLLDMSLNNKAVSEVLKTLKETGVLTGKEEYILNGIRFFQDINY